MTHDTLMTHSVIRDELNKELHMKSNGNSVCRRSGFKAIGLGLAAAVAMGLGTTASAIEFGNGEFSGSWDTTLSYGASWRIEDRCDDCVGKANINPAVSFLPLPDQIAAPGRFSVNSDDGNLNYDDGDLVSNAVKVTSELGFSYKNFGGFFRVSGFYDFENADADFLSSTAQDLVGEDFNLLDAFVYYDFDVGDNPATIRVGRQVVSWGENVFIQGGINVVNPVDVSKLRVAGAELKEAFLPIEQIYTSFTLTENLSLEALYMLEFEQIDPDPAGTYFATNDFGTPGAEFVMLGFGLFDEGTPGLTINRGLDRYPDDDGQYGLALRYYSAALNDTEFGLYHLKYHSRLPLLSGRSVLNGSPASGQYFVEYPEDIDLYGLSWNTTLGTIAFAGEVTYRPNLPLQFDDVELLFAALSPLNAGVPAPVNQFTSQLGSVGFGEEIPGWERHEVSQLQFSLTKLGGPNNWFKADQWVMLAEFGATKIWDLPSKDILRYQGPGTDTGGGPSALTGGNFRNPVTEGDGFADEFSWGYRIVGRLDYNNAFNTPVNLFPRIGFNHDVSGTTPGPGGNFIEDRKQLTLGLDGTYLEKWGAGVSYTRFFGGGRYNLLRDRDFVSLNVRYSF